MKGSPSGSLVFPWKRLWQLEIPSKLKHFAWRAGDDLLPCLVNLQKKKVLDNVKCVLCGKEVECVSHALSLCVQAKEVWLLAMPHIYRKAGCNMRFKDWLGNILLEGSEEDARVFIGLSWAIWHNRNAFVHEGRWRSAAETVSFVSGFLLEFSQTKVQHRVGINGLPLPRGMDWRPPRAGFFKLNVNGAVFVDVNAVGVGVVLRDSNGQVFLAYLGKFKDALIQWWWKLWLF